MGVLRTEASGDQEGPIAKLSLLLPGLPVKQGPPNLSL